MAVSTTYLRDSADAVDEQRLAEILLLGEFVERRRVIAASGVCRAIELGIQRDHAAQELRDGFGDPIAGHFGRAKHGGEERRVIRQLLELGLRGAQFHAHLDGGLNRHEHLSFQSRRSLIPEESWPGIMEIRVS